MTNLLNVYWDEAFVGTLSLSSERAFIFQYAPEWLSNPNCLPASLSLMPLRPEPFSGGAVQAFFANLLPEGRVKELIARRLGKSHRNDFALLEALGGDCAGALSLVSPDQPRDVGGSYEPLGASELEKIIRQLPKRPLLSPKAGIRLSLAGAQDKLPVYVEGQKFFLPKGLNPSSHILKPPIVGFDNSVENEVFCMTLARRIGFDVPAVEIWKGPTPLFLIERYDRRRRADGSLARIHQEDMCQALGVGYDQKYESEGGPSFQACFQTIAAVSAQPALDKQRLIQWAIFNVLIGNNDAHGKNVSLLIEKNGVRLAPFYDLMSTAVYPEIAQKMAMSIGRENRADWLRKDHWQKFADDADVAPRAVFTAMKRILDNLPTALHETRTEIENLPGKHDVLSRIDSHIQKSIRRMRDLLAEPDAKNVRP